MKTRQIAAVIGALFVSAAAHAGDVTANTAGWINEAGGTNNSSFTSGYTTNVYAGQEGVHYNDFFTFLVPTAVTISSATLNIWNEAASQTGGQDSALFSLVAATSYDYAGLMTGTSFGGVTAGDANTGVSHFVSITLNADGLAALNAAAGQNFTFGGHLAAADTCFDCTSVFGYTGGTPVAYLSLNTSAVPEPASMALMVAGLAAVAVRRRKA